MNTSSTTPSGDVPHKQLRLAAAARAVTRLPEKSLAELIDEIDIFHIPPYAGTEILQGLYQGGTEDEDVIYVGREDRYADHVPYDVIVTLYAAAQPAPWGVEEFRYGFYDAELEGADLTRVLRASRLAYQRWVDGDQVLVRCQAGVNRSGLVTALVLIQAGLTPGQAIGLIRERRGPGTLFNRHFVGWLMEHGQAAATRIRWDFPSRPDPRVA